MELLSLGHLRYRMTRYTCRIWRDVGVWGKLRLLNGEPKYQGTVITTIHYWTSGAVILAGKDKLCLA